MKPAAWPVVLMLVCAMVVPARPQTPANLPTARDVIDKYVAAVGGRDAILKARSRSAKGRFEIRTQGLNGTLQMFAAAPDKALMRITIAGLGDIVSGFDGNVGWILNPMTGPMVLSGTELAQARDDADFYSDLHDDTRFSRLEIVGIEDFDGRPCYRLRLVRKSGAEDFEFFDTETALLAGTIVKRDSPLGQISATHVLSDYRSFGGLRVPTKVIQRMVGIEQILTIEEMEVDSVDPSVFEPPAEIRALLKK
jgi:hypothetical protein